MLVKEIMVEKVVTLKPKDTLKEVVKKFSKNNISGAPVVDEDNKVIGIISEADVVSALKRNLSDFRMVHMFPDIEMIGLSFEEIPSNKKTEEIYEQISKISVSDMMQKGVKTVDPEDQIKAVIDIISSGKINRVPVVSNGKLVGIVTRGDIIKSINKIVK